MQPNKAFVGLPKEFWANVRTISQKVGYTVRPNRNSETAGVLGPIKVPTLAEITKAFESIQLGTKHLVRPDGEPTVFGVQVIAYFEYRADVLNRIVEPLLMDAESAERLFDELQKKLRSPVAVTMNKQRGKKKKPAFFTALINMLIEANIDGRPCNYKPQELTTITRNNEPFRTLARRIDGAFPAAVDPIAVWEIKEYYYTTTFGSRVADGVFETMLDGMELEELNQALHSSGTNSERARHIHHILMIDAHCTWWVKGRSYLCRIIDMLHMGYVDEVLFGREILTRLPEIASDWVGQYQAREEASSK